MNGLTPTVLVATIALAASACGAKHDLPPDSAAVASAAVPGDSASKGPPSAMSEMVMTGDPDRDFLRMMSDHHKGLIAIVHETVDSKQTLWVRSIARQLDTEQDAELDTMSTILEKTFKDAYAANATPAHQAMADQLKAMSGAEYDRAFLRDVISHHDEAISMIDKYLPQARNAQVKAMAQRMKATQTKEVADFRKKLATNSR